MVRGTLSPARAWRPAVAARLARTLDRKVHNLRCSTVVLAVAVRDVGVWVHRQWSVTGAAKGLAPAAMANAPPSTARAASTPAVAAPRNNKRPRSGHGPLQRTRQHRRAPTRARSGWQCPGRPCSGAEAPPPLPSDSRAPATALLSGFVNNVARWTKVRPQCQARPCSGVGAPPGSPAKAAGARPNSLPSKRPAIVGLAPSGARGQYCGLTPRSRGDPPRQAALVRQQPRDVYCPLPAQGVLPRRSPQLER